MILFAKNSDAKRTPTNTPIARLCVQTTTTTVATITIFVEIGSVFNFLMLPPIKHIDGDHYHNCNKCRHGNNRD